MSWTKPAATLAAYHAANVDTTPLDTANANELAQIDLQLRGWLYDYLSTIFESAANTVKPAAIIEATLVSKVFGSGDNDPSAATKSIVHGSVSTPDLKDLAVTAAKIATGTITATQIAATTITADVIASNAITTAKILNDAVDGTKIKDGDVDYIHMKADAIRTAAIKDGEVTAAKIAANVIGGDQLIVGTAEGQILVAGASPYEFAVKDVSGAITLSKDGVATLTQNTFSLIEETATNGTSAGESAACSGADWTTKNTRGVAVPWVETFTTAAATFVDIENGTGKITLDTGTYIIRASVPAYKAGKHICRLYQYNSADNVKARFYGSSENAAAADAVQTRSTLTAVITVVAGDYFFIHHWTEANQLVNGLGLATSAAGTSMSEKYSQLEIQKLA